LKGHGFSFPGGNQEKAGLEPLRESHNTMFEQATIQVQNASTFAEVKHAIDDAFTPAQVPAFLRNVAGTKLRVRQFEAVLAHGYLGAQAQKSYAALGDADRGQIREHYLRQVERVAPEIRQKFFRLYASY
jgi:hypothetical protein